jgi:hypothetical protein
VRCLADASTLVTLPDGDTLGITGLSRGSGPRARSRLAGPAPQQGTGSRPPHRHLALARLRGRHAGGRGPRARGAHARRAVRRPVLRPGRDRVTPAAPLRGRTARLPRDPASRLAGGGAWSAASSPRPLPVPARDLRPRLAIVPAGRASRNERSPSPRTGSSSASSGFGLSSWVRLEEPSKRWYSPLSSTCALTSTRSVNERSFV